MERMPNRWLALVLVLSLGLSACATVPEDDKPSADEAAAAEPDFEERIERDGSITHTVDNQAVALLWDQSQEAWENEEPRSAISALERAIQVAPEDPVLWSRLAEFQLQQGESARAENLAARSNALAEDRRFLRYRNWLIIEAARERRGDQEGAEQARQQAESLRNDS